MMADAQTMFVVLFASNAVLWWLGYRFGRLRQFCADAPRMRTLCEEVHRFADGELDEETAERMRKHLARCRPCRSELLATLQLSTKMRDLGKNIKPKATP